MFDTLMQLRPDSKRETAKLVNQFWFVWKVAKTEFKEKQRTCQVRPITVGQIFDDQAAVSNSLIQTRATLFPT